MNFALNPSLWIFAVSSVLWMGIFFLVDPKGIRNICAKFELPTNFFHVFMDFGLNRLHYKKSQKLYHV